MRTLTFIQLLSLLSLFISCTSPSNVTIRTATQDFSFHVKTADTPLLREKGLMNTSFLSMDEGMLFIFDKEKTLTFWMKDTLIPLDILFIDAHGKIVDAQTLDVCLTEPCPVYISKKAAKYALEVNTGILQKEGIREGDSVTLPS